MNNTKFELFFKSNTFSGSSNKTENFWFWYLLQIQQIHDQFEEKLLNTSIEVDEQQQKNNPEFDKLICINQQFIHKI